MQGKNIRSRRRWRKLDNLPIETRTLRSPISTTSRGRIKLWVEIIPVNYVDDIKMRDSIFSKLGIGSNNDNWEAGSGY